MNIYMKRLLFLLTLLCLEKALHAQYIYTIKADSVKITNSCDTAELIIENHTQDVCGFLFNKGKGRTEFRRGLIRLNDSTSLIGCDTLKMNAWMQGGNRFGTTGIFGTMDNNHVDFYTNGIKRGRLDNMGRFNLDYPVGDAVDAFSLTTLNGTKKWFNIYSDVHGTSMSFNKLTSFAGDLESMRITANGSGSTIETFAYSDLAMKAYGGLDLYGGYGAGATKYIRFFPHGTQAAMFNWNGNFLLGGETDYGYKASIYGTTYSQFFTNSTTPLGEPGSGALRLRWGGAEGTYVDFYYQGRTTRRGYIGTASDSRPLVITDSIGFSWGTTPYVTLGIEDGKSINSRFTIASNRSTGWDAFAIIGADPGFNRDFTVKASGNTIIGGVDADNGRKFQVNGTSWFGNDVYFYHPTFQTGGVGAGAKWVADNTFRIYGGPSETLTFGPSNAITSSSPVMAPNFYALSTSEPSFYVPASGGVYSTANSPGHAGGAIYHKFTIAPPATNSGTGSVTLVEINKPVNRGAQDGKETGLRILFDVTGTANNLRALETVNGDVRLHTTSGRTSIGLDGSSTVTSRLDVSGEEGYNQLRLRKKYTPTSSSDPNGAEGDVSWDDNYMYIKTSSGWKRSALSTF